MEYHLAICLVLPSTELDPFRLVLAILPLEIYLVDIYPLDELLLKMVPDLPGLVLTGLSLEVSLAEFHLGFDPSVLVLAALYPEV